MSIEIRWFFKDDIPDTIEIWIAERFGDAVDKPKSRTDIYLNAPKCEYLGIKLRNAKIDQLEIKLRTATFDFGLDAPMACGLAEDWTKVKWRDATPVPVDDHAAFFDRFPSGPWVEASKTRRKIRSGLREDGTVTHTKDRIDCGLSWELTKLDILGNAWWSLAFDVHGPREEQLDILQQTLPNVLADYPGPALSRENSLSYPRWIARASGG